MDHKDIRTIAGAIIIPAGIVTFTTGIGIPAAIMFFAIAGAMFWVASEKEKNEQRRMEEMQKEMQLQRRMEEMEEKIRHVVDHQPPPIPAMHYFRPTGSQIPGPATNTPTYIRMWRSDTRRFLKLDRNAIIRRHLQDEFRSALEYVWHLSEQGGEYLHPYRHLSRARGVLVRKRLLP